MSILIDNSRLSLVQSDCRVSSLLQCCCRTHCLRGRSHISYSRRGGFQMITFNYEGDGVFWLMVIKNPLEALIRASKVTRVHSGLRLGRAYLSKVFFFPVLHQFLPTKSNFCIFCGPLAALAKTSDRPRFHCLYITHIIFLHVFGSIHRELEICLRRFYSKARRRRKILRV